ncbi:hypothetical protein C8R47DRAFT_1203321 [Mycena vitilis]|nr:hypothetical protein C8R47DRAFT_1203321 [Mycena vitilis]
MSRTGSQANEIPCRWPLHGRRVMGGQWPISVCLLGMLGLLWMARSLRTGYQFSKVERGEARKALSPVVATRRKRLDSVWDASVFTDVSVDGQTKCKDPAPTLTASSFGARTWSLNHPLEMSIPVPPGREILNVVQTCFSSQPIASYQRQKKNPVMVRVFRKGS